MYFVGIDGGGTKSRLMAIDESGNFYGPYIGKSTNINSNLPTVVQNNIKQLVVEFLSANGGGFDKLAGFCIGSAGVDLPQNVSSYKKLIYEAGIQCPIKVVNDVELVLESETKGQPGMIIVSGTGSIAYGKDTTGKVVRIGGWGHLVGDEGSGYWIGKEAVRRCLQSFDGREKPTLLIEMLTREWKLKGIADVLDVIYDQGVNKAVIADFSRFVEQAAQEKDQIALGILTEAAEDLFQMAAAASRQLNLPKNFTIILSGGTILGSKVLGEMLRVKLSSLSEKIQKVSQEPCVGAVLLAKDLAGLSHPFNM